jgi:Domain of unknown function (DUF4224)
MSLFLSPEEVAELTDRHTAPAQVRRLKAMRIRFIYRKGGRVKVPRSEIEPAAEEHSQYALEPDFSVFDKCNKLGV